MEKEYPLDMKKHGAMGPKDIIDAINRQFEEGIIVTDVGQHQMFAAQYTEITEKRRSSCPEDLERWDTDSPARSAPNSAIRIPR